MTQHTLPTPSAALDAEKRLRGKETQAHLELIKDGLYEGTREFTLLVSCKEVRDTISKDADVAGWLTTWTKASKPVPTWDTTAPFPPGSDYAPDPKGENRYVLTLTPRGDNDNHNYGWNR